MTTVATGEPRTNSLPRVLMACSTVADGSGMMAAVAPLAGQLGRRGFNVRVVGPVGLGDQPAAGDPAAGVRIDVALRGSICTPLADALNAAAAVAEFAREGRRHVVHVHGVWTAANVAACLRARALDVPYVVSPHGMLLPAAMQRSGRRKRWALGAFVRRNLEAAALVHASSEAERAAVLAVAPAARTRVIPWGVDIPLRGRQLQPCKTRRQAVCIGRIIPLKGVDDLVAAWAAVQPRGWELRFIGSDPHGYARHLAGDIEALRLQHSVHVEPPLDHQALLERILSTDLVILPSHSENFGMVVAESLAAGVPVITTTATPWLELETRGCGWCVSPGSTPLAAALQAACDCTPEQLDIMGGKGRAWMTSEFAWSHVAEQFESRIYGFPA